MNKRKSATGQPVVGSSLVFGMRLSKSAIYFLFALLIIGITPTAGQVVRLPTVAPEEEKYPGQLVSHPDSSAEILQAPGGTAADVPVEPPRSDVRPGMFQKLIFNGTWLAGGETNKSFGQADLETKIILAMPCPTRDSPLVITPGFAVHNLDGPMHVDLPPNLFEVYTQFRWLSQVTPEWGLDFALSPGVFSDFKQSYNDAFRLTGHGAAAWTYNDKTKFVIGAAYLDRPDVNVIPIGGVIWTPYEDTKFDLIFPHPKISKRIHRWDTPDKNKETWGYMAYEFAGDAWAMSHSNGRSDMVVLSDNRLIFGLERKTYGGLTASFEVGYVFGRRIRFNSHPHNFYPEDTVLLRCGLMY